MHKRNVDFFLTGKSCSEMFGMGIKRYWLKTNFAVVMSDLQQHVVPATNCLWDCDIC